MDQFSFEKLDVWKKAKSLTIKIYKLSELFPESEKYGVVNQMRRASFSVANNIAEGSSRNSAKDKARFIEMAYGSLMEVMNILIIAVDLKYMEEKNLSELKNDIIEISKMLSSLKRSFLSKL